MADILDDFITRLSAVVQIPDDAAMAVKHEMRQVWGGRNDVWVRKHESPRNGRKVDRAADAIGHELARGVPVAQAIQAAGVSRATGFRAMNRPSRRR